MINSLFSFVILILNLDILINKRKLALEIEEEQIKTINNLIDNLGTATYYLILLIISINLIIVMCDCLKLSYDSYKQYR